MDTPYAFVARIEAKHHFAEADEIPAESVLGIDVQGHANTPSGRHTNFRLLGYVLSHILFDFARARRAEGMCREVSWPRRKGLEATERRENRRIRLPRINHSQRS